MNKILSLYKKHRGYLLSCLSVILIYPFGYLLKNKHSIPINEFLIIIPVVFVGILLLSLPFRLFIGREDN